MDTTSLFYFYGVLRMEPKASHVPGEPLPLSPSPNIFFCFLIVFGFAGGEHAFIDFNISRCRWVQCLYLIDFFLGGDQPPTQGLTLLRPVFSLEPSPEPGLAPALAEYCWGGRGTTGSLRKRGESGGSPEWWSEGRSQNPSLRGPCPCLSSHP